MNITEEQIKQAAHDYVYNDLQLYIPNVCIEKENDFIAGATWALSSLKKEPKNDFSLNEEDISNITKNLEEIREQISSLEEAGQELEKTFKNLGSFDNLNQNEEN